MMNKEIWSSTRIKTKTKTRFYSKQKKQIYKLPFKEHKQVFKKSKENYFSLSLNMSKESGFEQSLGTEGPKVS